MGIIFIEKAHIPPLVENQVGTGKGQEYLQTIGCLAELPS
jgi:hypothetical protein